MKTTNSERVSVEKLVHHLRSLAEEIGVRTAGSSGEKQAASYVSEEFRRAGAEVTIESFPVLERWVEHQKLDIRICDEWQSFPCSMSSNTLGTNGEVLEAPLCFFESEADYRRENLSFLKGKAVVYLGLQIESRERYRQLVEAEPAFLLLVDVRYPDSTLFADGMLPACVRAVGAVRAVNVAYMDAWKWKALGASEARLAITGGMRKSMSQNVIADLGGGIEETDLLIVGAHHDTVADSVGADDNGAGVAAIVELARILARRSRKRSIRLVSFGAEEELSIGSAEYVRKYRQELHSRARLMLNFDACSSHLGWIELICNGPVEMAECLPRYFERNNQYPLVVNRVTPYSDHFPFVAAGIPAVFLHRPNCIAGRFFHHRHDDDMRRVSISVLASLVQSAAELIADMADSDKMPFPNEIPESSAREVEKLWLDLYGGWSSAW